MNIKSVFQQGIQGVTIISAFWQTIKTTIYHNNIVSRYFVITQNNLCADELCCPQQLVPIPLIHNRKFH